MSCCSTSGSCGCPVQPCPSRYVVAWFPRVAFGLVLVGYGVNHYKNIASFVQFSSSVFPSAPMVGSIAGILAYIVPALMIVGGALFAVKQLKCVAKMCIVASLSGIIGWAGLAVLLGDGSSGNMLMPFIQNASVLLILYYIVKKMSCCGSKCAMKCAGGACPCGPGCSCGKGAACDCGTKSSAK